MDNSKLESGWYWKRSTTRFSYYTGHGGKHIHYYHKGKAICGAKFEDIRLKPFTGNEKKKCKTCKFTLSRYKNLDNCRVNQ